MPQPSNRTPGSVFAALLVTGLVGLAAFGGLLVWPAVRANTAYAETACVVLDKRLAHNGDTCRPEVHIEYGVAGRVYRTWTYDATGIYSNDRAAKQAALDRFVTGQRYPCWYDPADPARAVLVRDPDPWLLMSLVPLAFVLLGAAGLYARRKRGGQATPAESPAPEGAARDAVPPEVRQGLLLGGVGVFLGFGAAVVLSFVLLITLAVLGAPGPLILLAFLAPFAAVIGALVVFGRRILKRVRLLRPSPERQAARRGPGGQDRAAPAVAPGAVVRPGAAPPDEPAETDDWPTVPKLDLSAHRGETLAVRVPEEPTRAGCALACLVPFSAVWVGGVAAFAGPMIGALRKGQLAGGMICFLVPFLLGSLVLIYWVLRLSAQLLVRLLAGRVSVEVSAHPLVAGGRYDLLAMQSGLLPLSDVRVSLDCEEQARYTAGTDTRTETRTAYSGECSRRDELLLDRALAAGLRYLVEVPAEAMHSFEAGHNQVRWKLVVRGRAAGFLPSRTDFPVVVYPPGAGGVIR